MAIHGGRIVLVLTVSVVLGISCNKLCITIGLLIGDISRMVHLPNANKNSSRSGKKGDEVDAIEGTDVHQFISKI